MVHTANFDLRLSKEDVKQITNRFKESITLVPIIIDKKFKWASTSVYFEYKEEGYSRKSWILKLKVDFIDMLETADITESHYNIVEQNIGEYIYYIFGHNRYKLTLIRLDYRVDIKMDKSDREVLFKLYKKSYQKHGFKKIKTTEDILGKKKYEELKEMYKGEFIDNSIYFQSKSVSVLIYDKEFERVYNGQEVEPYEKDILRLEVALNNRHLNYKNKKYHTPKELKTYFKKGFFKRYIRDNLDLFINKGDHYKLYISEKIINNSELAQKEKEFLREFLVDVSICNLSSVMNLKNQKGKFKYTYAKRKKALKLLEELDINPISIPRNWKCKNHIENPLKYIDR